MGVYDCMYLLSKDQYQSMHDRAACGGNKIDGVGGDVRESQVNNIEVTHGGTVLIHDRDKVEAAGSNTHEHFTSGDGRGRDRDRKPRAESAVGDRTPTPDPRRKPSQYAAHSGRLSSAHRQPNAISPRDQFDIEGENESLKRDVVDESEPMDVDLPSDRRRGTKRKGESHELRRQALNNDREKNLERIKKATDIRSAERKGSRKRRASDDVESMEVDRLVRARLDQLQGGNKKTGKKSSTGFSRPKLTDREKGVKMIHEMRDIYKSELRHSAAREGLRADADIAASRGKKRSVESYDSVPTTRAKTFHHTPLAGRKRRVTSDDGVMGRKRLGAIRPLPPTLSGKKRGRESDEEDLLLPHAKKVRTYQYLPLAGRKRNSAGQFSTTGKRRRRGPSPPPPSRTVKRKGGDQSGATKRRRRGPSPPPRSKAVKRRRGDSDSDEYDGDPFGYRPKRKMGNTRSASVRAVGKFARVKRTRGNEWEDREQEEEATGVPFKSSLVTYDPLSSGDESM